MTNADKIRAMSDEELADAITQLMRNHRRSMIKELQNAGLIGQDVNMIDVPALVKLAHLKWLQEPAVERPFS